MLLPRCVHSNTIIYSIKYGYSIAGIARKWPLISYSRDLARLRRRDSSGLEYARALFDQAIANTQESRSTNERPSRPNTQPPTGLDTQPLTGPETQSLTGPDAQRSSGPLTRPTTALEVAQQEEELL